MNPANTILVDDDGMARFGPRDKRAFAAMAPADLLAALLAAKSATCYKLTGNPVPDAVLWDFAVAKAAQAQPFGLVFGETLYADEFLVGLCKVLLACPHFVELGFVGAGASATFMAMLAGLRECHLRRLTIIRNPDFGDASVPGVARLLHISDTLDDINLAGCGITAAGADMLQKAVFMQTLRCGTRAAVYMMDNPAVPDLWDDDAPAAPTPYFDAAHGGYLLVVNSLSLFGAAAPPQPPVAATKKKVGRPPKSAGAAAKKAGIKK